MPCDQQSAAAAAAAAVSAGDVDRAMLAGDEQSGDAGVVASVCSTPWCCCEQIRVAASEACPGRNVFPAQRYKRLLTDGLQLIGASAYRSIGRYLRSKHKKSLTSLNMT